MRYLILLSALMAAPAFAQLEIPLPRLYSVIGVAADDTLNIRQHPNASASDIGDLQPFEVVEVLALSEDGKWGEVSTGEGAGWVSTRYLALLANSTGDGIDQPYGVPLHMQCTGTEPFWSAEIRAGDSLTITDYSEANPAPQTYAISGMAQPSNTRPSQYGLISPPYSAVIRRERCDDGMSEGKFGWSIGLLWMEGGQANMYSGCCTAVQP